METRVLFTSRAVWEPPPSPTQEPWKPHLHREAVLEGGRVWGCHSAPGGLAWDGDPGAITPASWNQLPVAVWALWDPLPFHRACRIELFCQALGGGSACFTISMTWPPCHA